LRALACLLVVLGIVFGSGSTAVAEPNIDDATSASIDELLSMRAAAGAVSKGDLIELLSRQFLGTPYGADMLVGSATQPEQLVVDFRRVDCFTYLDYVEALSKSTSRDQFVANVIATRYVDGRVAFPQRRHFFSDWADTDAAPATDITATLSADAMTVAKQLNAKGDGGQFLPGLPVVDRDITYIPSAAVNQNVVGQLQTGDFIGAYTDMGGLDVTHVGIFVATPEGPVFRNASSLAADNKVVDSPFYDYVQSTPGIVVLRAK
jgi:hypothetical protein